MTLSVTGTCCLNSLSLSYHGYQLTRQSCVHSDLESEVGKEETLSNPDADVAAAAAGTQRDRFNIISLETDYQIAFHAPADSHTFKNSINGAGTLTHRYSFTKVFSPNTSQSQLFREMVLPRVQDFLQVWKSMRVPAYTWAKFHFLLLLRRVKISSCSHTVLHPPARPSLSKGPKTIQGLSPGSYF